MKKFNLEEYLKNPDREVFTREGRSARIICTNRSGFGKPIVALITTPTKDEVVTTYGEDGQQKFGCTNNPNDLFFAPEKKTGWINVSRIAQGNAVEITYAGAVYPTKEEAIAGYSGVGLLDTIQIEWEE